MPHTPPPYPLAQLQKRGFDSAIRARGAAYFEDQQVSAPQWEAHGARFTVLGSREYEVTVDWTDWQETGAIDATCDCPYARDGFACKHLWAVFLKLDQCTRLASHFPALPPAKTNDWVQKIRQIQDDSQNGSKSGPGADLQASRIAIYLLDLEASRKSDAFVVDFYRTSTDHDTRKRPLRYQLRDLREIRHFQDPLDREILSVLFSIYSPHHTRAEIPAELARELLPKLVRTQRLFLSSKDYEAGQPLQLQETPPWTLEVVAREIGNSLLLTGTLRSDTNETPLSEPLLLLESGWILFRDRIARLAAQTPFSWIHALRKPVPISIPRSDADQLISMLADDPYAPVIRWPESLQWNSTTAEPKPCLLVSAPKAWERADAGFEAKLFWDYGNRRIPANHRSAMLTDLEARHILKRDFAAESRQLDALSSILGTPTGPAPLTSSFRIPSGEFARIIGELLERGWTIEAEGRKLQPPKPPQINVRSGVDWFEVSADYPTDGPSSAGLPEILEAIRGKKPWIPLGDGSAALLPDTWARQWAALAGIAGTVHDPDGPLRFTSTQGLLLHASLQETDSEAFSLQSDAKFRDLGKNLLRLAQLPERKPSRAFNGELRPYQKSGLGWLHSLRSLGLGGILADDMGLGKTVQLLAHLDQVKRERDEAKALPSLIVVPKSLLYNWESEASRFAPHLKTLRYAGTAKERAALLPRLSQADLVIVTYGTLRTDLEAFRGREYDTVIIDEAQTIKNPRSLTHRACLALNASQRIALTGTPIENSILDLFALLDFTNPGLISSALRERFEAIGSSDPEAMNTLARALKPVILRRTKEEVLKDLPAKVEQTLYCELSPADRRRYEELRTHFRTSLQEQIDRNGFARSKILVLEALLRLRQLACHPGLLLKDCDLEESAKTQALVAQLQELRAEGHKALVFSQFTRFLEIVGGHLSKEGIAFEYLDGSLNSRERESAIERFKKDPEKSVFLISLKAGGVGLNLTEAGYVFVLDPWWNPAVESQAISRAHRIGQTQKVIAYRIIAKGTIEEKILELQKSKQTLADAVITADTGMLRSLTLKDLEILLG